MTTKVIHVVQSEEGERYIKLKYGDDAVIARSMAEALNVADPTEGVCVRCTSDLALNPKSSVSTANPYPVKISWDRPISHKMRGLR